MSQKEPHEVQQGQMASPVPGKQEPLKTQSGDALLSSSSVEKALGALGGQQTRHECA